MNQPDYSIRYPDDLDGRRRDKSIEVFASECICPASGESYAGYRVVASHDCWTGVEWLPILNYEEANSLESAVAIAKQMQDALYK